MTFLKLLFNFLPFPMPTKNALIALALGLAMGGAGAWYVKGQFEEAARAKLLEDALAQKEAAVLRVIEQSEAVRELDNQILTDHQKKQVEIREVVKVVTKEVPKYVSHDKGNCSCNLSRGAVGLLNLARQPWLAGDLSGLPETSGLTDAERQAPSTVTQRAEIEAHADCAAQYNELMEQHNALIDWLDASYKMTK